MAHTCSYLPHTHTHTSDPLYTSSGAKVRFAEEEEVSLEAGAARRLSIQQVQLDEGFHVNLDVSVLEVGALGGVEGGRGGGVCG